MISAWYAQGLTMTVIKFVFHRHVNMPVGIGSTLSAMAEEYKY